jgi:predicted HicB family RNase H-like nuclease
MKTKTKTMTQVMIRVDKSLKDLIKRFARRDKLSLRATVDRVLRESFTEDKLRGKRK